jgi:DNA polymerase-3 subunit beta
LFEAVQLASSIVPVRTPKPILQCAKIEADEKNKQLTVEASDSEVTVKHVITQVQITAGGAAVVPADRISAILRESQDETIQIEVEDAACEVIGADSRFRVYGHDPDDFPVVNASKGESGICLKADVLKSMIHRVSFAASRESSRYALNGVLWEQNGKKLRMVATDGRRLALVDGDIAKVEKDLDQTAIVPVKTMTLLERIVTDPEENIEIGFSGNQVLVRTATAEITGTLIQGRFPKYEDVIPSGCDKNVPFPVDVLQSAVRRAALLTNEQSRGVALAFSPGKLQLTSSTPEMGEAQINLSIDYDGDEAEIGFNPQYILEMLRVVDAEQVNFEFSDGKKPGLIRAGKDFLYVVMPVTV